MENSSTLASSDYARFRKVSFYYETSLQEAWEAFGAAWLSGEKKPLLIRLASNCFRSGIAEEDTVKWTLLHFALQADEPEVRLTIRNQYRILNGFGTAPCLSPVQQRALRMEEFLTRRYEFRYNTQLQALEYRERHSFSFDFRPVDRHTFPTLLLNARSEGLELQAAEVDQYLCSDRVPPFSPIENYLQRLPLWDGKDRIRPLALSVPCRCPLWTEFFFRWFIRLVAHWLQKDTWRPPAVYPLLIGPDGLGKAAFCRRLLPPELASLFIQTESFAALAAFSSTALDASPLTAPSLVASSLDTSSLSTASSGMTTDTFRRFALIHLSFFEEMPLNPEIYRNVSSGRYASLIATGRFPDPEGRSRSFHPFIPFEIIAPIRLGHPVDHEQLYAQALQALQSGERYWLSAEEEKKFG